MRSGSNSRWAMACTCSASTALDPRNDFFAVMKNWWKYISCRARLAMREFELSSPIRMLPLSWSLARVSSSSLRGVLLQLAEFRHNQVDHSSALPAEVPA